MNNSGIAPANPLPASLALRIALAARELQGIGTAELLQAIIACTGEPITEQRLERLRVRRLRESVCEQPARAGEAGEGMTARRARVEAIADIHWQRAVGLLKGRDVPVPALPEAAAFRRGDMPGSVRVACASDVGEHMDAGFSACARFLVYQVSPQEIRLIDLRAATSKGSREERLDFRAGLIADCQLLYTTSIGGPAAAKVVRAGVHPVKSTLARPARELARELQQVLEKSPPPWLARAMGSVVPTYHAVAAEDA